MQEISKPTFDMSHATEAIRYLLILNFTHLPEDEPFLRALLNQTALWLAEGQATSKQVNLIMRSSIELREKLPQVQQELLPVLRPLIAPALEELQPWNATVLADAATRLSDRTIKLNRTLRRRIVRLGNEVNQVPIKVLPELARAAATVLRGQERTELLRKVSERVVSNLPLLVSPFKTADLIWALAGAQAIDKKLQQRFTGWLDRKVPYWNKKKLDAFWKVVCAYAKAGIHDRKLMKLAARRALQEDLTTLSTWGMASLTWSFDALADPSDGLAGFRRLLKIEVQRRALSKKAIAGSSLGRDGGGDPELRLLFNEEGKKHRQRPIMIAPRPPLSILAARKLQDSAGQAGLLSG